LTLDLSPGFKLAVLVFQEFVMDALGIGQLAKRGGVGIDTVRYYERNGLPILRALTAEVQT